MEKKYKRGYRIRKYNDVKNCKFPQITEIEVETDDLEKTINDFVDKNTYDVTFEITRRYTDEFELEE